MKNKKGSILIVSLWVVTILFLLAIGLAYRVGLELHITRYAKERLKVFYIAKAGLSQAVAVLLKDSTSNAIDTFQEEWSEAPSLFKEKEIGDGFFSVSHVTRESSGGGKVRYGMTDEESRIPLNLVKADVLERIPGLEPSLVLSLRAWRGDTDLSDEVIASEESYYASLDKPYPRKGKPFETLEELLLVNGITPDLFEELKSVFTVYGSGKVNLNTASRETFVFLGLEESIAQRIQEVRQGEDGMSGTADDYSFEAVSDLVSLKTGDLLGLDQDQQLALTNFLTKNQELLSVQSTAFRLQVEGRLRQARVRKRIVAVVDRTALEETIRYWHEE